MLNKKFFLLGFILFGSMTQTMEKEARPAAAPAAEEIEQTPTDDRPIIEKCDKAIDDVIDWACKNKVKSLIGISFGSLVFYKIFERPIKGQLGKLRNFCEQRFIEALIKWEEIKDEGLTKWDYIKGLVSLMVASSIVGGTYYYGIDNSQNLIKECLRLLKIYKIQVGSALLGLIVAHCFYRIKLYFSNRQSTVLNFDTFLGQLTEEQRRKIFNSEDLLVAVGKGSDNHRRLLENQEFMQLLTDTQKSYLENIVRFRCSTVEKIV